MRRARRAGRAGAFRVGLVSDLKTALFELRRRKRLGDKALADSDLGRTVSIRGEPRTVLQAIQRQRSHYADHVGQLVDLARGRCGARGRSLSIPRGESDRHGAGRYKRDR